MEFDTLNELIEIPKKAEASKAKKKLYVEQMAMLLSEEGISPNAIRYLKSGFTFSGAKPVAIYLQKLPEGQRETELSRLLSSELFRGGDNLTAFRFGISLSAYSIEWFGEEQQILLSLMKILPFVSKNKEKQLLKDAPKIFEKYFLDIISESTKLPSLDISGLKEIRIREFRQMMFEIIGKVSNDYKTKAARIRNWVGNSPAVSSSTEIQIVEANVTEGKGDSDPLHHTVVINNELDVNEGIIDAEGNSPTQGSVIDKEKKEIDAPIKKAKPYTQKELADAITLLSEFSARFGATITEWSVTLQELNVAKTHIYEIQKKLQQTEEQLDVEKKQNEQVVSELNSRSKLVAELNMQLRDAKEQISEHEEKIREITAENARLNSILSVYSSDKQNSQSEQLNAIASKLKSEYRDFKEVENEEMSIDLGENFRFQIQSIFKILNKAGIDVERR